MIISALEPSAYNQSVLFSTKVINRKSKHIILLNENDLIQSQQMDNLLKLIVTKQINAIFLKNLIDRVDIYAWNPPEYRDDPNKLIYLNELEFFSSSKGSSKDSAYSGLFFNNIQSFNGSETEVLILNDPTNVYNVIGPDLKKSISGIDINIINIIGESICSKLSFIIMEHALFLPDVAKEYFSEYVDKSYNTQARVEPLRDLKIASGIDIIK